MTVFDEKLWATGGGSMGSSPGYFYSGNARDWSGRDDASMARTLFSAVSAFGKMWVLGGGTQNMIYHVSTGETGYDMWGDMVVSSDGIHWEQVTNRVPWGFRSGHSSVVFDNKIWVLGGTGYDYNGTNIYNPTPTSDIWCTPAYIAMATVSIMPKNGPNTGPVNITRLSGEGFAPGTTVKLVKAGQADINAANVTVIDSTTLQCAFDLTGKAAGPWDVVVTRSGVFSTLVNGFEVQTPGPATDVVRIDNPVYDMHYPRDFVFGVYLRSDSAVDVKVLTARGEIVKKLCDEFKPAGNSIISWDGRNESGEKVGSGMYFIQTITDNLKKTHKIVVLK